MIRLLALPCRLFLLVALTLWLVLPTPSRALEMNILTGGPTGTYIQFGQNIADEAAKCGLTLNVRESAGSLENFLGVRQRPVTQFGIVQSDVLEYLKTFAADDPAVARAIRGVRIAFPLYNEEIHILARRDIASLQDLSGRRVAIGTENSGTFLTASLVMDLAQIDPSETLPISAGAALDALLAGDIDAFFYVAGAPTKIFQNPDIDAERFHLLPIEDPTLQAVYLPAEIPAASYPFQSEPVEVVAVKAVLMTYEYDSNKNTYHRESCKVVSDTAHVISSRFQQLTENGHPKWKQVDLTDLPPGWSIGECVNTGLDPAYPLTCEGDGTASRTPSGVDANAVYRKQICATFGC